MLHSLHIENYILIESLDIDFPESLIIITGETGAGKSILLGAVSLMAGGKADSSMISAGADSCVVEAEFEVDADSPIKEILEENDAEWDDGRIIIRRVIYRTGRSRAFVNDSPVSLSALSDISSRLIDIHSQHQSLLLSDKRFQMSVIDSYALCQDDVNKCRTVWAELQSARNELSGLKERLDRLSSDREYNQAQLSQIEAAKLTAGEVEVLEAEQRQLSNSEDIKDNLSHVESLFNPSQGSSIDSNLKEASRCLEKLSRFYPELAQAASRLESARIEIADISSDVEERGNSINFSAERLVEVEERLSLIYSLLKKHSCRDLDELFAVRDEYAAALGTATGTFDQIIDLEAKIKSLESSYKSICELLHSKREEASKSFAEEITKSLRFLELERSVFGVSVEDAQPGPSGSDSISFMFSASGSSPVDVAKCASGGEMSRIMLSLKAMMAKFTQMPTLVFDEIDTGVSGSVADKMGSMICSLGDCSQVFAITHLPQVAAKGRAHYIVRKSYSEEGAASSTILRIQGESRIKEIARLLSGATITSEALANAESLLNLAD